MPPLDIKEFLLLGQALVGALGAFFAVKYGQAESHRLLKALHSRFDELEKDVVGIKLELARVDERQKASDRSGIYRSQRFRLEGTE